jgi:glycosyltransferase involved in cell wall biosynthesis
MGTRLRILLITGALPPMRCGVGEYTRGLARALVAEGAEVAVLTSAGAAGADPEPYQLLPVIPRWSLNHATTVRRVIRAYAPDVIHQQLPAQGYDGPLACLLPLLVSLGPGRLVQTWHEYLPGLCGSLLADLAAVAAPGPVVVVRPAFRERMPTWFRPLVPPRRLHLIPNAPTLPLASLDEPARAAVRARWAPEGRRLVAFFGFPYRNKGVDDLLAILDPARDHLVIAGAHQPADPYQADLARRLAAPPWDGHASLTGFLPEPEAAALLAAADAVVLPFRLGGGHWNTSLKAAVLQGTFVLTTATDRHGYDEAENVYWARPGDVADLQAGLEAHLGHRRAGPSPVLAGPSWPEIARAHLAVYRAA